MECLITVWAIQRSREAISFARKVLSMANEAGGTVWGWWLRTSFGPSRQVDRCSPARACQRSAPLAGMVHHSSQLDTAGCPPQRAST